jgi:hypothetical protein
MRKHLIHIGYAKAGSTLLQRWFRDHPQMLYEEGGLAGVRNVLHLARQATEALPAEMVRVSSSESLASPTPWGGGRIVDRDALRRQEPQSAAGIACAELADLFPNAYVLLVTRGFRSMMLSSYSQYVRSGGTDDFFALNPEFGRPTHRSKAVWDYDRLIALYRARFGDRLLVLPYEYLRDEPAAFVRIIEDRLEIAPHPPPGRVFNAGLSPEELRWYPRITRAVKRLPLPAPVKRRVLGRYIKALDHRRLRGVAQALQRVRRVAPLGADAVSPEVLENFRGRARSLRADPLYRKYRAEYLLDD